MPLPPTHTLTCLHKRSSQSDWTHEAYEAGRYLLVLPQPKTRNNDVKPVYLK